MTHRQFGTVDEKDACFLTFQAMKQGCHRQQQRLHQSDKARIARRLTKQRGILMFDAMFVVVLEVLVGRIVEHDHD